MSKKVKLMDVNDVASALRVSVHSVRRWIAQEKLRPIKLGSRTLFDPQDVANFVELARRDADQSEEKAGQEEQCKPTSKLRN